MAANIYSTNTSRSHSKDNSQSKGIYFISKILFFLILERKRDILKYQNNVLSDGGIHYKNLIKSYLVNAGNCSIRNSFNNIVINY